MSWNLDDLMRFWVVLNLNMYIGNYKQPNQISLIKWQSSLYEGLYGRSVCFIKPTRNLIFLPLPPFPSFCYPIKALCTCFAMLFHICDGKIRSWAHAERSYTNGILFIYHMLNSSPIDANISVLQVNFRQFLFIVRTYNFAPYRSSGLDRLYCAHFLLIALWPWVDSASNRNEYREYFLGVNAAGA
jgi:hypothetical protein